MLCSFFFLQFMYARVPACMHVVIMCSMKCDSVVCIDKVILVNVITKKKKKKNRKKTVFYIIKKRKNNKNNYALCIRIGASDRLPLKYTKACRLREFANDVYKLKESQSLFAKCIIEQFFFLGCTLYAYRYANTMSMCNNS